MQHTKQHKNTNAVKASRSTTNQQEIEERGESVNTLGMRSAKPRLWDSTEQTNHLVTQQKVLRRENRGEMYRLKEIQETYELIIMNGSYLFPECEKCI